MLRDLVRAVAQLSDPATRRWVWISVAGALGILIGLVVLIELAVTFLGETGYVWLDWIVRILSAGGALLGAWFLFPAVATVLLGMMLDPVVDAVEARHYPGLPPPRKIGLVEGTGGALRLGLLTVLLNLLVLPLYFVPVVNLVVALLLNGFLLGREYVELVAARRMARADVKALRARHGAAILAAGAVVAALLLIPFVNLVAPVVGIALFTHRLRAWRPGPVQS
jgi:CysZ protein